MKFCAICCLILTAGCYHPVHTRLPTFYNRSPAEEKRSFSLHDPLPEEDAGPETFSRPRGFESQRSEPRRTLEGRGMMGVPAGPGMQSGMVAPEYPGVVPQ